MVGCGWLLIVEVGGGQPCSSSGNVALGIPVNHKRMMGGGYQRTTEMTNVPHLSFSLPGHCQQCGSGTMQHGCAAPLHPPHRCLFMC